MTTDFFIETHIRQQDVVLMTSLADINNMMRAFCHQLHQLQTKITQSFKDTAHLPKYTVLSHFGHFDAMFRLNKDTESLCVAPDGPSACLPTVCSSRRRGHTSEVGDGGRW